MNKNEELKDFNIKLKNLINEIIRYNDAHKKHSLIMVPEYIQKRFKSLSKDQGLKQIAQLYPFQKRYNNLGLTNELLLNKSVLSQVMMFPYGYKQNIFLTKKERRERFGGGPLFYQKAWKQLLLNGNIFFNDVQTHFTFIIIYFNKKISITYDNKYIILNIIIPTIHSRPINDLTSVYLFFIDRVLISNKCHICNYFLNLITQKDPIHNFQVYITIQLEDEYYPRHIKLCSYRHNIDKSSAYDFYTRLYNKLGIINTEKYYSNATSIKMYLKISTEIPIILEPLYIINYHYYDIRNNANIYYLKEQEIEYDYV